MMETLTVERDIRILIVEDHPMVRAGIRSLLRSAGHFAIVGEATDGAQALDLADGRQPDVVLLDLALPVMRGDEVLDRVMHAHPKLRVLIVTADDDAESAKTLLANGAAGYLTKDEVPACLVEAVRSIYRHKQRTWVSPKMVEAGVPSGKAV